MKHRFLVPFLWVFGTLYTVSAQNTTDDGENGATPIWSLTTKIEAGTSNICGATFADTNAVRRSTISGIYYTADCHLDGYLLHQP